MGSPRWYPRRWAVWSVPPPALALVVVVELVAAAVLGAALAAGPGSWPAHWPVLVGVLVVCGVVSTEASLAVERIRQRSEERPYIDLSSVWAFAAAVLLPPGPASLVVVAGYLHTYLRVSRRSGVPLHRVVFSTATVVLAVQAATAVIGLAGGTGALRSPGGVAAVLVALLAYAAVNMTLVVAVIVLSGPARSPSVFLRLLARPDEAALEFATLAMGALVAGAIAALGSGAAVLVLPPLIVLHRAVLVRQFEVAASTDSKTGLLNAAAWRVHAGRALRGPGRDHATVLVLDLDHFKEVNDRHGHLVGDEVLAAVAAALRAEVRDDDVVGRFGGEEFIVLLAGLDGVDGRAAAGAVAERIRRRVAGLQVVAGPGAVVVDGLTVSIGGATLPVDGSDLPELIRAADEAMYGAKHAGRNAVRMGPPAPRTWRG